MLCNAQQISISDYISQLIKDAFHALRFLVHEVHESPNEGVQ